MPSKRPSAAFDPISPDLDLAALVEETPNFEYVTRVSCDMIEAQSMEAFEKLVLLHVIIGGKPLVIEGFQHRLDEWNFTSQWLRDNHGKKFEQARNLTKHQNMALSIGHYLNNMSKLTNQWNKLNYKEPDRQRIYLKDIDCPAIWRDKLAEQVPLSVFYLNESTGEIGGAGSLNATDRGVARAGDLMSCLPPLMRAENMMCYIGHEGTYTPAHREMCASLGQNIMVETSGTIDDEGKPAKPGSSIWFMTETNDRHLVSEYWLSTLGHDIEVESHFAQINAWKAAPFTTYIVEQKAGDFILIPPLAPHQVWNRGTRTMKVAWNRTTVETLEMALHEALPRARMVCRDEQYKNKAIVYFALQEYSDLLKQIELQKQTITNPQTLMDLNYSTKIRQLQKDFRRLFSLYTEILLSEMLPLVPQNEKRGQYLPYDGFVTCSYCRCNIFNRFLTCTTCVAPLENGEEDTYDICMDCFAMGRSCYCISKYKWVEQFPWQDLVQKHESWRNQVIGFDGVVDQNSPRKLHIEREKLSKKTLAQVCQEQLKMRPWKDPKNPVAAVSTFEKNHPKGLTEEEQEDMDEGDLSTKRKKARKDRLQKGLVIEHVSLYPRDIWKVATCSKCDRSYSYGSLWRMFDMMPLTVMENPEWECPYCLKICSCGSCRKRTGMKPYEPNGTVLGHDTRKVADPRSVESLVDFSHSNMSWIKTAGDDHPHETRRLSRRIDEAEKAKAKDPTLDDNYVDEDEGVPINEQYYENGIKYNSQSDIPIDPMLSMGHTPMQVYRVNDRGGGVASYNASGRQGSDSSTDSIIDPEITPQLNDRRKNVGIQASGTNRRSHTGSVPIANISDRNGAGQNTVSNGISYEYPDPTLPQSTSTPTSHVAQSTQQEGARLKPKHTDISLIHSDAASLVSKNTSNQASVLTQTQQSLQDAKQNDRYIIAEAANSGKSLYVTLSISKTKLASIRRRSPPSGSADNNTKELLQSDMPSASHVEQSSEVSKKRKVRTEEEDDDFNIRKRRDRSSAARLASTRDMRKKASKYTEVEVSSESESFEQDAPSRRSHGPRPLPKYLARRSEVDDLPSQQPRSRSLQGNSRSPSDPFGAENLLAPHSRTQLPLSSPSATAVSFDPAQKVATNNLEAKKKAVQWADDDDNNDRDSYTSTDRSSSEPEATKQIHKPRKLMAVPTSMFSRPGMAGKKIKVTGAKAAGMNGNSKSSAGGRTRHSLG